MFAVCLLGSGYLVLSNGGRGGTLPPVTPVAQAAERTAEYPGARLALTGSFAVPGGRAMTMRGEGAYNAETGRFRMRLTATPPAGATLPGGAFDVEEVGEAREGKFQLFIRSPLLGGRLLGGADWIKMDLSDALPTEGMSLDPRAQLEQLGHGTEVRKLGAENVRGEPTTRYRVKLDQRLAVDALREEGKDRAADALEALAEQTGSTETDVHVWVARDDTIRRYEMGVPFALPGVGSAQMRMTVELFDFGVAPRIELPDEGSVFDASKLAREGLEQLAR